MEQAEKTGGGCLKRGCLGCGALVGLLFLSLAVLALVGRFFTPDVVLKKAELGPERVAAESEAAVRGPRGTLALNVDNARVELRPAPAGTALRIEADYDSGGFALREIEETGDDGAWTYRVDFHSTLGLLGLFRKSEGDNLLVVHVPADLPIDLQANLSKGEAAFDLGTLDLGSVAMDLQMGDYLVEFPAPTRRPLERLAVHGRMAGVMVTKLGNASPREAAVSTRMAGLEVDLAGDWREEAEVSVHFDMGGCVISAPASTPLVVVEAHVDGGEADVRVPERSEEEAPLARPVRLSATGTRGGLVVRQR